MQIMSSAFIGVDVRVTGTVPTFSELLTAVVEVLGPLRAAFVSFGPGS